MDRHEWKDMTDSDGGGALVGIYILEREDGLEPLLRYQYTDGTTFLSEPARADWMPEMLRLAERERKLRETLDLLCSLERGRDLSAHPLIDQAVRAAITLLEEGA